MFPSSLRSRRRRTVIPALGALAALTAALALVPAAAPAAPTASPAPSATSPAASTGRAADRATDRAAAAAPLTLRTPYGAVKGRSMKPGAQAFLGLPFAKAPVYSLAWKAPQKPKKWSGVRDATEQAPACTQYEPTGVKNGQATSQDCLYLDVYRPADIKKGERLPVLVFFHGGAGTQGSGVLYGGQTMATRDRVIVVSTNYRLGAAGNLSLPSLDAEDSTTGGNFAVLDQVETLKWVHKSIRSFGGDRNNVTIQGQSAGGRAVCSMLATPLARGLFKQAIIESSTCARGAVSKQSSETASENYAAAVGCPAGPNQLACLRGAWPATLVTQFAANKPAGYTGAAVLPQSPGDAIAAGSWNKVPVLTGNTRWEQKLQNQQYAGINADQYAALITDTYGQAAAQQILAKYPASAYAKPFYALAAVKTDAGAGCQLDASSTLFRDQGVPVYRYEFDDPTSPTLFGFQPAGIDMSSAHSVELAYLFDFTLGDRPLTKKELKLSRAMQDYWTAFATKGKPRVKGAVKWPNYATTAKAVRLGPTISSITGASLYEEHNCAFIAQLPPK